ncbi:hypothetical protein [Companilactobacillus kimchii]|uniref:Cell surface SD repeat-containing protein n=2 Tax=Companilactobacillus kimchii TaxID=2801452 RepID=A0ABR5NUX0_9LACO|nr:hypothetical protein [Companilactobacillus kimchii]KAE9558915.1 hypothetical protein ATN91_12960 [Companilactobacillus kimchii]KRK52594.1 hypothetical protein FC97_GL002580 [Companilactobacillus kimchii DSM 13961 = JCM 10707]OWF32023.1 hypothetical protein LKACC12383_02463 [Companilactobacillus kimchii]GEO48195.1 hypothetical protein LKI01_21940 [Companilactobacillus paralimentarius]
MKKKRQILISTLFSMMLVFTAMSLDQSNFDKSAPENKIISKIIPTATTAKAAVTPYHTPTADPIILLFIWLSSGYNLQPENQYTYVNNPKTLYTDSGRSVVDALLGLLSSPHYTWYQSTDGQTWTQMSQTTKELTVTPTKVGTVYYQQMTRWYGLIPGLLDTIVYSKVAFITTFPSPINATALSVKANDNYLYNNQSSAATTYVTGTPTPNNATGNITWKVSDTSLATVDSRTGLVTANTSSKSGTVRVTGTMSNSDGTSVSGYVDIKIGGGLDDQTVDEGKKATFAVQGKFDEKPTNVVWHKVDTAGKDTVVTNNNSDVLTYTTANTVYATDNGTKYYAVLTVTSGDSTTTVTTNKANLSVRKNVVPDVSVNNTIFNSSYEDHNSENTIINNVAENDKVIHRITVKDSNLNSALTRAEIQIKLPKTSVIDNVKVNNQNFTDYISVSDPDNNQGTILTLRNLNFVTTKDFAIEINSTVGKNETLSFDSTVSANGYDTSGNLLGQYLPAQNLKLNFADNSINLQANDWSYKTINSYTTDTLLDRDKIESSHLEVDDKRRNKQALTLYLSQKNPFKSDEKVLNSEMRYYQQDGSYEVLNENGTLVSETVNGQTLDSVAWQDHEGPKLFIGNSVHEAGNYTTQLEWSLIESIS